MERSAGKIEDANSQTAKGTIIVSGGNRGLGAEIVQCFLDDGYKVATFSRTDTDFTRTSSENRHFYWSAADCSDYNALKRFVKDVDLRMGPIVGLINNAALGIDGILATMRSVDIDQLIDINLRSQLHLTRLAIKKMLVHREGCIINISSINAIKGHKGTSVYSATKAAMDAVTRSLARELGPKGIRVNSVSPGYFHSDMVKGMNGDVVEKLAKRTPLARLAHKEEIAELILFLVSKGRFITGQNITIDGGFTC